jgi:DNA-binding SARP family transcriptional activator
MGKVLSIKKLVEEADDAEEKKNISLAKEDYEQIIKKDPLAEKAYDRLMILYRKEKDYKSELKLINSGIKEFERFYKSRKTGSKKIAEISKKLNRSFGFTDKKGNAVYDPEPIARWKKRKVTVEKRIKK